MRGRHALGVAVLDTGDSGQTARTCASLELCRGAAAVQHRLLVVRGSCGAKPPDGWTVLEVPADDPAALRDVALAHSRNCDWLFIAEGTGTLFHERLLQTIVARMERGDADSGLVRVAIDAPAPQLEHKNPDMLARMIGVTVVTPKYAALADESIRRFRRFTGLEVLRIEVNEGDGFKAKLNLPALCPWKRIVFFDADWWLLRPVDLTVWHEEFCAVPDPSTADPGSFCRKDAETMGLPVAEYFNSGFFIADFERETVRDMFTQRAPDDGLADVTDQSHLNRRRMECDVWLRALPLAWNYYHRAATWGCVKAIPPHLLAIHAAGVPVEEKQCHLEAMAMVFSEGVTKTSPPPVEKKDTRTADDWLSIPTLPWGQFFAPGAYKEVDESVKIEVALRLLKDETSGGQQHWKTRANAKCFLSYRYLEGQLPEVIFINEVKSACICMDHDEPMFVRWEISQATVDIYVAFVQGRHDDAMSMIYVLLRRVWAGDYLARWQPMLANVLRVMSLAAYVHYLRGQVNPAKDMIEAMVNLYQEDTAAHQWKRWPLRFEEARSDLHALVNTMFIARALGMVSFPDHEWLDQRGRNKDRKAQFAPYRKIMRELGQSIAPERDLFA